MLLRQTLKQTLSQKIDPKLILANQILACSMLELSQTIDQELVDNPALERPDEDVCGACTMPKELCSDCPLKPSREEPVAAGEPDSFDWYSPDAEVVGEMSAGADADYDPLANMTVNETLQDNLRDQLRAESTARQFHIGEYIIGNINPAGYLEDDLSDVALVAECSVEEAEEVLAIIQQFEPTGVGARNLQECLLIQLRSLEEQGEGNQLALRMVQDHWSDTASRKVSRLAHHLKASKRAVTAALDFIKERLTPYPGESYRSPWDSDPGALQAVHPDIIVRRTLAGFEIDVLMSEHHMLAVNAKYREAYNSIRGGNGSKYSAEERQHVIEFVDRAETFMRSILQRRKTLRAITKYVVEYQQGYLETSQKAFLRPLTRTTVSKALNIHESTVSRATANKWMMLPSEEVVNFDLFFDGSMSIKDAIMDIIGGEDKARPLSDQEIAEKLQAKGLRVARRTVLKYRESQNILSSRRRRAS